MTRWGWYIDGGGVTRGTSEDLWALLEEAVEECVALDHPVDSIRVGSMVSRQASDLIDGDDVRDLSEDRVLTARVVVDLVTDRYADIVEDGRARTDVCGVREFERLVSAVLGDALPAAILQWADDYIELDPEGSCCGQRAWPLEWREGEWTLPLFEAEPSVESEPAAIIVFTPEPSPETGDCGWCWWALGKMGEAPTLREAMGAAERVIAAAIEDLVP